MVVSLSHLRIETEPFTVFDIFASVQSVRNGGAEKGVNQQIKCGIHCRVQNNAQKSCLAIVL